MSEICRKLHLLVNRQKIQSFPFDPHDIPLNGIYVLFEKGEPAHGVNRIVRIGTHTGNNQLPSRLDQHFIHENKDRSIFRKNIGRALLNKDNDPFLDQWELDLTSREARQRYARMIDTKKQSQVERRVTEYIQLSFSFVVFEVPKKEDRLKWESRMISTVSWCQECKPSPQWLGSYSPKEKIREGGLWIVNELYKQPLSEEELEQLISYEENYIEGKYGESMHVTPRVPSRKKLSEGD
jgi:hypothetical protein